MIDTRLSRIALLVASTSALVACSGDATPTTSTSTGGGLPQFPEVVPYESFDNCDALVDWARTEMLEQVGPYGLDGGWYPYPVMAEDMAASTEAPAADGAVRDESATGSVPGGTSETNVQEIGVDEGDITETDGRFVYSIVDQRLRSVDLDESRVVSDLALPTGASQMILDGNRLIVATESWSGTNETIVSLYDVVDGTLSFARRDHLEGWLVSLRSVDGTAHVVLRSSFVDHLDFVFPTDDREESLDAAEERNREIIEALTADDLLPRRFAESEFGSWGDTEVAIECERLGRPEAFSGWGVTWVVDVDLTDDEPAPNGSGGLVADSEVAYVSTDNLYVTSTEWARPSNEPFQPSNPEPPHTNIHVFDLASTKGSVEYLASGAVEGTVLNSYALSEHDGHLRIATTSYREGFGGGQDNGVHVFAREGSELVEVGSVRGLGRGEQIQGVRYDGTRGYVVTFRQTDPLYVLDLSDPAAPAMVGELKIPGYSTYLKPIDGDRVLGIGLKGDDNGLTSGVQVSLFDVSDPSTPVLVSTADIGEWSNAVYDPHALLWWSATNQLVIPKDILCDSASLTGCESAVVLRLVDDRFVEQGRLFQWFPVQRAMIAAGRLVTVSAGGVMTNDLQTLVETDYVTFDLPWTTTDESVL